MKGNILKSTFIILIILSLVFILIELFFFYKLTDSKNNTTLKEEYFPLLKYSKISEQDLTNHFQNITNIDHKHNGMREYHPYLIYLYKPNLKSETFYTNSFGLLDEEPNLLKKQILILGSSVVGGGLRQNFKENIDGYLEEQINKKISENKYEVLNGGIGGYISDQEFNLMHLLTNKIFFDKIIYMSGANDIDARYRVKNVNNLRSYDTINSRVIKSQIEDNLILRNNPIVSFFTYIKLYFIPSLNSYKFMSNFLYSKRVEKINPVKVEELNENDYLLIDEIVQNYLTNVKKMLLLSEGLETKFYVGLQPTIFTKKFLTVNEEKNFNILINKYGYKYALYYKEAYPMMKKGLKKLKIEYPKSIELIETDTVFDDNRIDIFRDNVHFLEYGNEAVSKKIFNKLIFINND